MLGYVLRKVFHTAFVAFGVVTLVFAALRLSGDPAATMLPGDASVEELAALRRELGLDRPLWAQYVQFLGGALSGDFGTFMSWVDEFRKLKVRTNADTPHDANVARRFGAEGIGLCRTLNRKRFHGLRCRAPQGALTYHRSIPGVQRPEAHGAEIQ